MKIVHDTHNQAFVLLDDKNRQIGEITYCDCGENAISVPHTEVDPTYEGQGLASRLLDALVEWAQSEGLRVVPVCPYVVRAFRKHPEKYAAVMQ